MSYYETAREGKHPNQSARPARDPLQIPIALSFDEDRAFPGIVRATRDIALWLAVVFGAALGVLFVGASVPELRAAAPDHTHKTPAIVQPGTEAKQVREWYLPDVLFSDKAAVAEPIDTF